MSTVNSVEEYVCGYYPAKNRQPQDNYCLKLKLFLFFYNTVNVLTDHLYEYHIYPVKFKKTLQWLMLPCKFYRYSL